MTSYKTFLHHHLLKRKKDKKNNQRGKQNPKKKIYRTEKVSTEFNLRMPVSFPNKSRLPII